MGLWLQGAQSVYPLLTSQALQQPHSNQTIARMLHSVAKKVFGQMVWLPVTGRNFEAVVSKEAYNLAFDVQASGWSESNVTASHGCVSGGIFYLSMSYLM